MDRMNGRPVQTRTAAALAPTARSLASVFARFEDGSSLVSAMYCTDMPAPRVSPSEVPASESEMPSSDEMESFFCCFSRSEVANPDDFPGPFSNDRTTHQSTTLALHSSAAGLTLLFQHFVLLPEILNVLLMRRVSPSHGLNVLSSLFQNLSPGSLRPQVVSVVWRDIGVYAPESFLRSDWGWSRGD